MKKRQKPIKPTTPIFDSAEVKHRKMILRKKLDKIKFQNYLKNEN